MAIVKIEGKNIPMPDQIVAAGIEAVRAALSVDFPGVENADIQIVQPDKPGAPAIATVSKRAAPKGTSALEIFTRRLQEAPPGVNPAIVLAGEVIRAEAEGDVDFLERKIRSGELERAISEGRREGRDIFNAMRALGHSVPASSTEVPVGF